MAPTYKYSNLKKETNSSGEVDLTKVKKTHKTPHKPGKTLRDFIAEGFAQVNKQFTQVNKQFTQVNKQFAQVHKQLDNMNKRLNAVENTLTDVIETNDLKTSKSKQPTKDDSGMEM